jgi:hypothetical protein
MIRALVALIGFAAAAALLAVAPEVATMSGTGLWWVYLVVGAAGLVAGAVYQLGGVRSPGIRVNVPLFLLVFVPWTALAVGLTALTANPSSFAARWTANLPNTVQANWQTMLPVWWFAAGLLLAFSIIEPRVRRVVAEDDAVLRRPGEGAYGDDVVVARRPARTADAETTTAGEPAGDAVAARSGSAREEELLAERDQAGTTTGSTAVGEGGETRVMRND